jgi:glucokinase
MTTLALFGIGSSRFRYCLGTPDGELLTDVEITQTAPERLAAQIVHAVERLQEREACTVDAVSVVTSGLVDGRAGVVREMDTRDKDVVHDVRVAAAVEEAFDVPTYLENDCNAAALGEYAFGAGDPYDCVVHVTMGTGIGAGVVERGRLFRGEHGQAAEVGLLPLDFDDTLDSFGVRGAWEAYCSGRGIPGFVRVLLAEEDRDTPLHDLDEITAERVFGLADEGDPVASEYVDHISRYNAAGVGAVANVYNPGLVTLGGGVVLYNRERVLSGIEAGLDDYTYVEAPEVEVTPLGGDIGLYGAMARVGLDEPPADPRA